MKLEAKARLTSGYTIEEKLQRLKERRQGIGARADAPLIHQPGAVHADVEDPLSDGAAFDTLIDGEPAADQPSVQKVTENDGGVETAPEQELLIDDIVEPSITFG